MEPEIVVRITHDINGKILDISTSIGSKTVANAALKALIGLPMEKLKGIATVYSNLTYAPEANIAPTSDATRKFATLGPVEHNFLYLDCGFWGGNPLDRGLRTFGLVWGQWAALCEFKFFDNSSGVFDPADIPQISDAPGNGINEFLREATLRGAKIKVLRAAASNTRMSVYNTKMHSRPVNLDYSQVRVILPDLHLPIVTKTFNSSELEKNQRGDGLTGSGRIGPAGNVGDVENPRYTHRGTNEFGFPLTASDESSVVDWNNKYRKGDIFTFPNTSNNAAEKDLVNLLNVVNAVQLPGKSVHLIQVGDMYDLWIGLGRFFDELVDSVRLKDRQLAFDGASHTFTANDFIDYWINNTNNNFPSLANAFARFRGSKTFLYGNHDNYLAVKFNGYSERTGINQREKEIRKGGHFIEHGHRGDSSNCDGAIFGHQVTQAVLHFKFLRAVDPNQRAAFVTVAALAFIENPDFFIYAMAHTHSPYLTSVKIVTQLGIIQ